MFINKHGNIHEKEIFIRDSINDIYIFEENKNLGQMLASVSTDNILIYTINTLKFPIVYKHKIILRNFDRKIQIVDMNNIPIEKNINVLMNDKITRDKTVELIKHSDLDIEDYTYFKNENYNDNHKIAKNNLPTPQEIVLRESMLIEDMNRLMSIHRSQVVQSMSFDSTGTQKIVAVIAREISELLIKETADGSAGSICCSMSFKYSLVNWGAHLREL